MQKAQEGRSRLKRVTLIGDHHQLPPVVKNMAFQRYSHLDQSLFTRFVRLGSPFIQLNAQVCLAGFVSQSQATDAVLCVRGAAAKDSARRPACAVGCRSKALSLLAALELCAFRAHKAPKQGCRWPSWPSRCYTDLLSQLMSA